MLNRVSSIISGFYKSPLPVINTSNQSSKNVNFSHDSYRQMNSNSRGLVPLINPNQLFNMLPNSSGTFSSITTPFKSSLSMATNRLKIMEPSTLKTLGKEDKKSFFRALLPAAIESERIYGVPASLTLAQAALESGWARSPIGGFNVFGIKGKGPAGTVNVKTKEFYSGKYVSTKDNFAKYNNFYEAVMEHGKLFHNRYFKKHTESYAQHKNIIRFVDEMAGTYATDPNYAKKVKKMMNDYQLIELTQEANSFYV